MQPPSHAASQKIAGIEMLRAVAVLMVLVQHLPGMLPELWRLWMPGHVLANFNGSAGVDMFFCISGFVVARSLDRDLHGLPRRQALDFTVAFWLRRAFRLWPAAWVWLIAAYIVSIGFNQLGAMDAMANRRLIPAGIGMYANYLMIHASHHQQNLGIMSQYWSLSLEEQFYLVLPTLLLVSRRATLPVLLLYTGYRFLHYRDFWSDIYLRPGCLVAGVILARLEGGATWRVVQRIWRGRGTGLAIGAGLILASAVVDSIAPYDRWLGFRMFRLQAPMEMAICFTIVLIAVQCSPRSRPGVAGRALQFLGSRSYAIYLVHELAFAITREVDFRFFLARGPLVTRLVVSLPIAAVLIGCATEATFRLLEQPMRARGREVAGQFLQDGFVALGRWSREALRAIRPAWPLPNSRDRILDIELLRAIAITFVMVQHLNYNLLFSAHGLERFLSYGELWPGVDLFFVISGFLVTRDLFRRLDPRARSREALQATADFWFRRAWRLWPTAWLWLAIIMVGSALFTSELPFLGPAKANVRGVWAGVLFYANIRSAHVVWDPYGASFPYWSLSLEEQFYFLLPLLMLLLGRVLPWAAALCIALQFPLAHDRLYYFCRSDALLWGVVLAAWHGRASYARLRPTLLALRLVAPTVLLCALAALFRLAGPGNVAPPYVIGLIAAISAALVWIASYDQDYLCPNWARGFVLWMGSRSYALYVAHVPVFNCSAAVAHYLFTPGFHPFTGAGDPYALAVAGPLLVGAAELTYRCVEQPLRRVGSRLTNRNSLIVA